MGRRVFCGPVLPDLPRGELCYEGTGASLKETAILEETALSWRQTCDCQSSSVETVVCGRSLWVGEESAFLPQLEVWGETVPTLDFVLKEMYVVGSRVWGSGAPVRRNVWGSGALETWRDGEEGDQVWERDAPVEGDL